MIQKEVPGVVANRLQCALLMEAFSLVRRGVVTPEELGGRFLPLTAASGRSDIAPIAPQDGLPCLPFSMFGVDISKDQMPAPYP